MTINSLSSNSLNSSNLSQNQEQLLLKQVPGNIPLVSTLDNEADSYGLNLGNESSTSQNTNQNQNRRCYNVLIQPFLQIGVSLKESEALHIYCEITGYKQDELQNLSDADLKAKVDVCAAAIINAGIKCNSKDVLINLFQGYRYNEELNGNGEAYLKISKSQYNTHGNLQGFKERMEQFFEKVKRVGFDNLDKKEQKEYVRTYVQEYLVKNKSFTTIKNDIHALTLNMHNDEDRKLLYDVIKELNAEGVFNKFSEEQRGEIVSESMILNSNSYDNSDKAVIDFTDCDGFGLLRQSGATSDQIIAVESTIAAGCLTDETAQKLNNYIEQKIVPFWEENENIIESINQKYVEANGVEPELTPEERRIYEEYQKICVAQRTAQNIGYTNSELTEASKKLILTQIQQADAGREPLRRDTLAKIQCLIQEEPDIIKMPVEDFEKFMDEVTSGNYTIVKNDVANNTYTELNDPIKLTDTEVSTNGGKTNSSENENALSSGTSDAIISNDTAGIGFVKSQEKPNVAPEETKNAIIRQQVVTDVFALTPEVPHSTANKALEDADIKKYKESTGKTTYGAIIDFVNSGVEKAIESAIEAFKLLDKRLQEDFVESYISNNKILTKLIDDVLSFKQIKTIDAPNNYIKDVIEEKREKEANKIPFEANV